MSVTKVVTTPARHRARWTQEELNKVLTLAVDGVDYAEIGKKQSRTTNSILFKIASHVNRITSDEESARKGCDFYKLDWKIYSDYVETSELARKYRRNVYEYKKNVKTLLDQNQSVYSIMSNQNIGADIPEQTRYEICTKLEQKKNAHDERRVAREQRERERAPRISIYRNNFNESDNKSSKSKKYVGTVTRNVDTSKNSKLDLDDLYVRLDKISKELKNLNDTRYEYDIDDVFAKLAELRSKVDVIQDTMKSFRDKSP